MSVKKSKAEIATIDCNLVTIETEDGEFGFDTANQIEVEPQIEEEDAVRLVVKGILRAQKPVTRTITGNQITLHDNVFNPELVVVLQGGTVVYDDDGITPVSYTPPVAGSSDKGESFTLNCYTAQYNAAGQIINYEKIAYPNCQGQPVAFGSEDGAFRAPEYVIDSAPNTGEAPYVITYVDELPELLGPEDMVTVTQNLTNATSSFAGNETRKGQSFTTKITAVEGGALADAVVTMGGTDISSTAVVGFSTSDFDVVIDNVTGDIVITATANV